MIEMIHNIQEQFIEILKKVDWMDDITRKHALEKAKVMEAHIAYPDELLNDTIIDNYYQNVGVSDFIVY